jgi:hypothetical protein
MITRDGTLRCAGDGAELASENATPTAESYAAPTPTSNAGLRTHAARARKATVSAAAQRMQPARMQRII